MFLMCKNESEINENFYRTAKRFLSKKDFDYVELRNFCPIKNCKAEPATFCAQS